MFDILQVCRTLVTVLRLNLIRTEARTFEAHANRPVAAVFTCWANKQKHSLQTQDRMWSRHFYKKQRIKESLYLSLDPFFLCLGQLCVRMAARTVGAASGPTDVPVSTVSLARSAREVSAHPYCCVYTVWLILFLRGGLQIWIPARTLVGKPRGTKTAHPALVMLAVVERVHVVWYDNLCACFLFHAQRRCWDDLGKLRYCLYTCTDSQQLL